MTDSDRPKFLLGVGCQKAGTSWLYDYLKRHKQVFLPSPKELHVFDAVFRADMFSEFYYRWQLQHASRGLKHKLKSKFFSVQPMQADLRAADLVRMIDDPSVYVDYFRNMSAGHHVVGEITPSYAALSRENFAEVQDLLSPHFDMRVVLLLRDPVQRAFSAVRHFRRVNAQRFPHTLSGDDNALFERMFDTAYVWERANYPRIIEDLEAAFGAKNVHIEFFERLFNEEAVSRLCAFLGIEQKAAAFDKIVNASPRPIELGDDLRARAEKAYSDIYEYCFDRFPEAKLRDVWLR